MTQQGKLGHRRSGSTTDSWKDCYTPNSYRQDDAVRYTCLMPLGKFFTLSPAGVPGCVVEVSGGAHEPGAEVVTSRPSGLGESPADHQLWWWDRSNHSVRSKLTNFCMCANKDGIIEVQPYQPLNRHQRWRIDGHMIKSRDNEKVLGLDEKESHPGGHLFSQDIEDAYGEEWTVQHVEAHYLHIKNSSTGKVLDVARGHDKPGASVIVYDLWMNLNDNQMWYEDVDGVIRSKMNDFALTASKNDITMEPFSEKNRNQQWVVSQHAIINRLDPDLVLDICLPKFSFLQNIKGSFQVVPAEYNGGAPQRWELLYADHSEATFGAPKSRYVHLRHEMTGLVMSALPLHTLGIPSERTDVVLEKQKAERAKEQLWLLDTEEKRIVSGVDGKCLDLSGEEVVLQPREKQSSSQAWHMVAMTIQNGGDPKLHLGTSSGVLCPDSSGFVRVVAQKADAYNSPDMWIATKAPAAFFYIRSKLCERVLDVKGGTKDSGGDVILYDRKSGDPASNQLWYEDEASLIRSKLNGYVLDCAEKTIKLRPYRPNAPDQQWIIFGDVIKNRSKPDLVLDIRGGKTGNCTPIIAYKFHNQANQKWIFDYV